MSTNAEALTTVENHCVRIVPAQRKMYQELLPDLLTEEELIVYLRIPEVSKAGDYHNVVANLKRMRDLPCIHISKQPLYPVEAVREWIRNQVREAYRCN